MKKNTYWFKAKQYGWGWYPVSRQGLLISLVSIIIFIFFWIKIMYGKDILINSLLIIADFLILLFICYKKGERPKWRWGNK